MRRIGTLEDGSEARKFCDYLLTLDIDAAVDGGDGQPAAPWEIWIRNEEDVDRARIEWSKFQQAPNSPQYNVETKVAKIRDQKVDDQRRRLEQHRILVSGWPHGAAAGARRFRGAYSVFVRRIGAMAG